jgi:murein DD-endopeptidase MepM/ murein hydrolase activator NlpD
VKRRLTIALALTGVGAWALLGGGLDRWRASAEPSVRTADFALTGELTQGGWARGRVPSGTAALTLDGKPVPIAPDGSFFLAFDRDSGSSTMLSARLANGTAAVRTLSVSPRAWRIEHIPIGPRPGARPSEAFRIRREAELAQINAARAIDRSQRIYNGTPGSYHSGTDIATGASGTPFVAPADGVVILAVASPFTLEGNLLMIDHGMGLNSAFLHCSQILVKQGEAVKQGQVIGRIGMTGRATGPHLHWSIKWRNARLDPILFTGPMN